MTELGCTLRPHKQHAPALSEVSAEDILVRYLIKIDRIQGGYSVGAKKPESYKYGPNTATSTSYWLCLLNRALHVVWLTQGHGLSQH